MIASPTAPPGHQLPSDASGAPIVVTGAGGFIGQALIPALLAAGHDVRAITRDPARFRLPGSATGGREPSPTMSTDRTDQPPERPTPSAGARTGSDRPQQATAGAGRLEVLAHPGTARDVDWDALLAGAHAVIHGAGIAHVPLGEDRAARHQLWQVNVRGTRQLARAAARAGVRRFIFLSSIKAAGEWSLPGQPLRASDPPRPEDCYGVAKLAGERLLLRQARQHPEGMSITIIRPPLVYGPGVKANFAALLKLAASGLPLPLGSLDNERSFLSVRNLGSAIQAVLAAPDGQGSGVFHLADGAPLSTPALIRAIAAAAGKPARLLPVPPALLGGLARLAGKDGIWQRLAGSLAVDSQPFCQQFGWQPPLTMREALAELYPAGRP